MTYELKPETMLALRKEQARRLLSGGDVTLDELVLTLLAATRVVSLGLLDEDGSTESDKFMSEINQRVRDGETAPQLAEPEPEFTEPPAVVLPPTAARADEVLAEHGKRNRRTKVEMEQANTAVLAKYRAVLSAGISQPLALEAAVREGTVQRLTRKAVESLVSDELAQVQGVADKPMLPDPLPVTTAPVSAMDAVGDDIFAHFLAGG